MLKLRSVRLGGPEVRDTFRAGAEDDTDGTLVHMYRDSSVSPVVNQRRSLNTVPDVIQGVRAE